MSTGVLHARYQRSDCFPTCKIPDKRDFMDPNPAKSNEDFYREYDPWIGIGTAIILALFFMLITLKSCIKWLLRRITVWRYRYQHCQDEKQRPAANKDSSTVPVTTIILPNADNGHVSLK
ncbi:unnamed protein product [Gongylonema pulchrum]|uniref:FXYD domain-containing ion transport regulator n=1 Tax=Gongylonema pulchrum TaxID=637853 RepID=A0A183CXI6_9BILA|nr:unnamed protein product [Gongylonema pulchrum]